MILLFIGDVVGRSGCDFIKKNLYKIKKDYEIDVTIINGENSGVLQPNNYMLVITPINRAIFLSTKLDFRVAISKYLWYNSK